VVFWDGDNRGWRMTRKQYKELCRSVAGHSREYFIKCYHDPSGYMLRSKFGMDVMREVMAEIGEPV